MQKFKLVSIRCKFQKRIEEEESKEEKERRSFK